MDTIQHPKHLTLAKAESTYNLLTSYRFAQRYAEERLIADICWEGLGYGTRLLAEYAEHVTGLAGSPEEVELASMVYAAPNVVYQRAHLPELPCGKGHFDVVTAFSVVEKLQRPEDIVREAKRVLKREGVLIISTPDKQAHSNDRNHRDPAHKREMYLPELREMLERHFKYVRFYRQGAVAGGLIFESTEELANAPIESTRYSSTIPIFGVEPPAAHFVVAICSNSETLKGEIQQPYLLLDRDRRIFDEYADYRDDVDLLRNEIQHMQETEVQAFQHTMRLRHSEILNLEAQLKRSEAQLRRIGNQLKRTEDQTRNLRAYIHAMENSKAWRLVTLYRRLRAKVGSLVKKSSR